MNRHVPLVAAVLVLLVAMAAILFAGKPPQPERDAIATPAASFAAAPVPVASPSVRHDPSASPSVGSCAGGRSPVLTGEDMPEAVAAPAALDRRVDLGVYVTSPLPPLESTQGFEIWAVRRGTHARRIGFSADRVVVDDLAPDGSFAVLSVDHPRSGLGDCFDLVTIATDGSGDRWIAASIPGSRTLGARVSPDGEWLGYTEIGGTAGSGWLELRSLDTYGAGATPAPIPCSPRSPNQKGWSPDGLHLAAVCDPDLVIAGTDGTARRFPLPSADAVQAFAWSSPTELDLAMTPAVNDPAPVTTWHLDTARSTSDANAFSRRWTSTPSATLVQDDDPLGMSPGGHGIVVQVEVDATPDFPWDEIDLRTGRTHEVSDPTGRDREMQAGGTTDAGRASFVVGGNFHPIALDVVDLGSWQHTSFGRLPTSYLEGRWRLP
jgi:hypothetical protein